MNAPLSGELSELRAEALEIPASERSFAESPPPTSSAPGAAVLAGRTPEQVAAGVAEWRSLFELAVQFGSKARPQLAVIYTPATIAELAGACDAVAAKYNVGAFGFLDRYKEEITLGVLAWNLAPATLRAIKGKGATPANDAPRAEPAARPGPPEGALVPNNDKPTTD